MSAFITWLRELFTDQTYGQSLETFIVSRNPTSNEQVESLEREWHMHKLRHSGKFLVG
jgi:hypothetical protein